MSMTTGQNLSHISKHIPPRGFAPGAAALAGAGRWLLLLFMFASFARTAVADPATSFYVYPYTIASGPVTIALVGYNLPPNGVVTINGRQATTWVYNPYVLVADGYVAPWQTGAPAVVTIANAGSSTLLATASVPVQATAVSFDVAARFATQAAFGPRPDVVLNIQQIGLQAWITQQLALPPVGYNPAANAKTQFVAAATGGPSLLRLRVAAALQTFMVSQCIFQSFSCLPYERMLERDASGNFRTLMTDLASDASMGMFLNLAGSAAPSDPTQHPNQNFARELMQLFTIGPDLLNEDGTLQLDGGGRPIPAYTQAQIVEMSRVFTGWNFPPAVDRAYTGYYGFDYGQPLAGFEAQHDQGSKVILGGLTIPANQGVAQDRKLTLDAIFAHPNLPPRISRLLIQHLVKSAPTPAYVQRMAKVFENDGNGVRGNLTALVTAILLDPEARSGDTALSADDGFLQDPMLFQLFVTSTLQIPLTDDQSGYYASAMGENWWYAPSVFGFYRPEYVIPGTTINSPEFQIFNNQSAITRSEFLWGMVSGTAPGYWTNSGSWLNTNFSTVPDLLEAVDHLAFHGQMPAADKAAILAYCNQADPNNRQAQFNDALFLALGSDGYTVSH